MCILFYAVKVVAIRLFVYTGLGGDYIEDGRGWPKGVPQEIPVFYHSERYPALVGTHPPFLGQTG